jgi:hypothetical protein
MQPKPYFDFFRINWQAVSQNQGECQIFALEEFVKENQKVIYFPGIVRIIPDRFTRTSKTLPRDFTAFSRAKKCSRVPWHR